MVTVTVNGVSVERVLAAIATKEMTKACSDEAKQIKIARTITTKSVRNHSGRRSGRCRILFHRGEL